MGNMVPRCCPSVPVIPQSSVPSDDDYIGENTMKLSEEEEEVPCCRYQPAASSSLVLYSCLCFINWCSLRAREYV